MFSRIEVGLKPEYQDPVALPLLRRMEMSDPHLRKLVRWARALDVYWLDVGLSREELIFAATEAVWDPVLHWLFTGNLIPSAAGTKGSVEDLLETAPNRPGKFYAIEKRFRLGVTDHAARSMVEAYETVLKRKIPDAKICSGQMLLLEGPGLLDENLARIAREFFANELIESWTILSEKEITHSERFHPERVRREMPKTLATRLHAPTETLPFGQLSLSEIHAYARKKGFRLGEADLERIQKHFSETERRDASDAELEVFSKVWGERIHSRWIEAPFEYSSDAPPEEGRIPAQIKNLIHETFQQTTRDIPRSWVLSSFEDQGGVIAFDEEDAVCIESEIESKTVSADSRYGAMIGISEGALKAAATGLGMKPIGFVDAVYAKDVLSVSPSIQDSHHPRRVLDGAKQGLSEGGSQLGIPCVSGALYTDVREGVDPIIHVTTLGHSPRAVQGRAVESREAQAGDFLLLVGGPTGKEGLLGAPAVQIPDTVLQKRLFDFILEARDLGLTRALFDLSEGGLSYALFRAARLYGGVEVHLDGLPLKQSGMKTYEILGSETLERAVLVCDAVAKDSLVHLAQRRGLLVADLGKIADGGRLRVWAERDRIVDLDLKFLKSGYASTESHKAEWTTPRLPQIRAFGDFSREGLEVFLRLMSHPNVSSREWLIRQLDHEVQGMSAMKPLHSVSVSSELSQSGPNDGAVLKLKPQQNSGLVVGSGMHPRLSYYDPYLMGQMAVDEAVRNAICVGADYGREESPFALSFQLTWPEKESGNAKLAAALVRGSFGARDAATELAVPFISGITRATTGSGTRLHCVVQAVAKTAKLASIRSSDFKGPGDAIYLVGPAAFSLFGSQTADLLGLPTDGVPLAPDWDAARRVYAWMGGAIGKEQRKLRSIHDVSDGGMLVALSEGLLARTFGATIQFPEGLSKTMEWEFLLGEGFHTFVVSMPEMESPLVEAELAQNDIPFCRLGSVTSTGVLQVKRGEAPVLVIETKVLRQAWKKEGYWE